MMILSFMALDAGNIFIVLLQECGKKFELGKYLLVMLYRMELPQQVLPVKCKHGITSLLTLAMACSMDLIQMMSSHRFGTLSQMVVQQVSVLCSLILLAKLYRQTLIIHLTLVAQLVSYGKFLLNDYMMI